MYTCTLRIYGCQLVVQLLREGGSYFVLIIGWLYITPNKSHVWEVSSQFPTLHTHTYTMYFLNACTQATRMSLGIVHVYSQSLTRHPLCCIHNQTFPAMLFPHPSTILIWLKCEPQRYHAMNNTSSMEMDIIICCIQYCPLVNNIAQGYLSTLLLLLT